jgi:plasmid stabilization system protein ParE
MIYQVSITEQAEADLRGIYEYIAFEKLSPENAAGQIDRLEKHIMELESFPKRYREYDKEPWYSRGLRIMPVDNYVVFYIPITETGIVSVVRVMYAGRDIDNQLNNFTDIQK